MLEHISLFFVMILQVIIPQIPAELVVIGAARSLGVAMTTAVAGSGLLAGSLLVYFFGRGLEKVIKRFFDKEKVETVKQAVKKHENILLAVRVLPYNPSDIISYVTGIVHVDLRKILVATTITSYLRCFLLATLGQWITDLVSLSIVGGVLLLSAAIAYYIVFKKKGEISS